MQNLKRMIQMNLFTKQIQTQGLREITYGYQRERVEGRIDWEFEIDMYIMSVQFSHSVVSNSLRPHEPQHARPPCPSQTPGVYSDSCPSSR